MLSVARIDKIDASMEKIGVHELGHNFGLLHANYWDCGNDVTRIICPSVEYGDYFDIMGYNLYYGYNHFNAYHKRKIGWIDSTQVQETVSPGNYFLVPLETEGNGIKTLKIPTMNGYNYYIEFIRPIGYDAIFYNY